jgi:hypothetical protein
VTTPATLPDNVAALRALVLAAWAERDAERAENAPLIDERDQLAVGQNDRLRHLIRQLQRMQFGKRSEKLDPDQFALVLEDLEQAVAAAEAEAEKDDPTLRRARSKKRHASRGALPDHLRRVEVVIEPDDNACPCCGGTMHVIGEDRSQRLDLIPAPYRVIVTPRPKYACRSEGAENWAMLASTNRDLQATRRQSGMYLTDVSSKLVNNWPNSQLIKLRSGSGPPTLADRQVPAITVPKHRLRLTEAGDSYSPFSVRSRCSRSAIFRVTLGNGS